MVVQRSVSGVVIGATIGASTAVNVGGLIAGHVHVPASSSLTTITWHGSYNGTDFSALQGSTGTAITNTSIDGTAGCYVLPSELAGLKWIKGVGNAAETVVVSGKYESQEA